MQVEIEDFQKAVVAFRKQLQRTKDKENLEVSYKEAIKNRFINGEIPYLVEAALAGEDPKLLVVFAEAIAQGLSVYQVTKTMLRNIFGYAKKLETSETGKQGEISKETLTNLYLLVAKIAYTQGKEQSRNKSVGPGLNLLKEIVEESVERIGKNRERFKNFIALFESIISYFRYYNP